MQWSAVSTQGPSPLPRSLHSAVLLKNKMVVFGGWVPVLTEEGALPVHESEWKCSNSLACLNIGMYLDLYCVSLTALVTNRYQYMGGDA